MKKYILAGGFFGLFAFSSCKEVGPAIDFSGTKAEDTTYPAAVETPEQRRVLVEDFTGVSCPPCPTAQKDLKAYDAKYPDRLVVIGHYILSFPQSNPVVENGFLLSKYDFRTQVATDIGKYIFGGIASMPIASIDRTPLNGSLLLERTKWNLIDTRETIAPPVNLRITSSYNGGSKEVTVKVKMAATQDLTKKINLTVGMLENKIIDAQKNTVSGNPIVDTFYEHNHVLRDLMTPYYGYPVLATSATITAGTVYERTFKYTISNTQWVPANMKVYAFISYNTTDDKEVLQAAETVLAQ